MKIIGQQILKQRLILKVQQLLIFKLIKNILNKIIRRTKGVFILQFLRYKIKKIYRGYSFPNKNSELVQFLIVPISKNPLVCR